MVKQKHQIFVSLLCLADGAVVAGACYAAWAMRRMALNQGWPDSWREYLREPLVVPAVPLALFCLWLFKVYRPRRDRSLWVEQKQIIKASLATAVGMVLTIWLVSGQEVIFPRGQTPPPIAPLAGPAQSHQADAIKLGLGFGGASMSLEAGRFQLGAMVVLLTSALCTHRLLFRIGLRQIRKHGWNLRHVCVIGVGRLGRIACRTIDRNSWTGINVAFFISHREKNRRTTCLGRPVLGGLQELERHLQEQKPDAVYLAIPNAQTAIMPSLLRRLERFPVDVRIIPDVHPRFLAQSMSVGELDGMPILGYRENPQYGLGGLTKRLLDISGALVGLCLLSPLLVAIAAVVRWTSPGPAIFRQRRVSLGGEVFNIYKFRTMYHMEDEQGTPSEGSPSWTARNDSRITPVGKWLRRTSLDELPQLFNVLKGEMSMVGPRPERPELIERFRDDWRGYVLRQHVKAGITGWAQVNGLRGDTSLKKRLQHDLFYIRHWSLGFDLKILWLTLFRGFVHRNAH